MQLAECLTDGCLNTMNAKLADGTDFVLGMTIYRPMGDSVDDIRPYPTSEAEHEIQTVEFKGESSYCIGLKGSGCSTDLLMFYATSANAIKCKIEELTKAADKIDMEIMRLKGMLS